MGTIKSVELRERERQSLCLLVQAQWQIIMVRGLQVASAEEETEMYSKGEKIIEGAHEQLALRIEDLCKSDNLSADGSPMDQLERIAVRLHMLEDLARPF